MKHQERKHGLSDTRPYRGTYRPNLTTEYRRAAGLTRRGDTAFYTGRFFYAAAYADRLLSACRTAADAAERIYSWHFSIAQ